VKVALQSGKLDKLRTGLGDQKPSASISDRPLEYSFAMHRILRLSTAVCLFLIASCGGGGAGSGNDLGAQADFTLEICSLGCGGGTCAIRQINTNSDLVFTFNDTVDPASVSFTQISMVNTANGGSPTGQFLVDGNKVIFRPSFLDTPAGVVFGFDASTEYSLTLFASPQDSAVVKSAIGRPNLTPISCTFTADGVQDFVPGAPLVTLTPSEAAPPADRGFNVELSFNDVVRSVQLVDEFGNSPTVAINLVSIDGFGQESVFEMDGEFIFEVDINQRQTKLTFVPLGSFPSGANASRWLRVDVSNQITDLVGNFLQNSGSFNIPLPEGAGLSGALSDDFSTIDFLDQDKSTPGLWIGDGGIDSRLNPVTGTHNGGGHGVLGSPALDQLVLDTDSMQIFSELLNATVTVNNGVFLFSDVQMKGAETAFATGSNPLRIFVRGSANIFGTMDFSGENAPVNFGMYRPNDERLSFDNGLSGEPYPSTDMQALLNDPNEAVGGEGGIGQLTSGSGGQGGLAWYQILGYYNDTLAGWFNEHHSGIAADPARFLHGFGREQVVAVHGSNGQGVGGVAVQGAPLPLASSALITVDQAAGSGMGSWAWPPKSDRFPDDAEVAAGVWTNTTQGLDMLAYKISGNTFELFNRARSRGGGGGGYWSDGERGDYHDENPSFVDSFGASLVTPNPNRVGTTASLNWDFNGVRDHPGDSAIAGDRVSWPSYIEWDQLAGGSIEDAEGGRYRPLNGGLPLAYFTLDPDQGFLMGGSGGGGAGNSEHGSYNNQQAFGSGIESFRSSDGGGGGAGGGAVQLHVAGDLNVTGTVSVGGGHGGDSASQVTTSYAIDVQGFKFTRSGEAGGGGGSGGALLLQVGGNLNLAADALDLAGGLGGIGAQGNHGGQGGAGILRLETPDPVSLADMAAAVEPIEAFDLETRPEYGLTGANSGVFEAKLTGSFGDLTVPREVGTGNVFFNGNSSGIGSDYYLLDSEILFAHFTDYQVTCEWSNGSGAPQTIVYSDANPTTPGVTPIWLAFATAYGFLVNNKVEVVEGSEYGWVVPGYNTVTGGAAELLASPAQTRLIRFQAIFDQDLVQAFIGNNPNAYFRITKVSFPWTE
jgi:hypothetical protein